jgi:tetratricopeptide (TPR) repeat protein
MSIPKRFLAAVVLVQFLPAVSALAYFEPRVPTRQDTASNSKVQEADQILREALQLYRQGKLEEALARGTKAANLNPNDHQPHALAGFIYMAQQKYKSASGEFAIAIRLHPQDKRLYLLKAQVDFGLDAREEALTLCRKALEVDPSYAEAHAMIGDILRWDEKRRSEAITAYQSALKIRPDLLPVYQSLGELLDQNKEPQKAEEVFKQGLAADPNRMNCRFALGRMLVQQGKLVEARELWNSRTSDVDNTHPNFIVLLERAEKLKRVTDALAQKPDDPEALVEMGLVVMEGESWVWDGRQERAMVYFQKALGLRPGYARAQYAICKGYIQIADLNPDKKKTLDLEMEKLKRLDMALFEELKEYRKNYVGGLRASPVNVKK